MSDTKDHSQSPMHSIIVIYFYLRERSFITGRGGVGNFGPGAQKITTPPPPTSLQVVGSVIPHLLKRSGGIISK